MVRIGIGIGFWMHRIPIAIPIPIPKDVANYLSHAPPGAPKLVKAKARKQPLSKVSQNRTSVSLCPSTPLSLYPSTPLLCSFIPLLHSASRARLALMVNKR
jgi:hypothetical protein